MKHPLLLKTQAHSSLTTGSGQVFPKRPNKSISSPTSQSFGALRKPRSHILEDKTKQLDTDAKEFKASLSMFGNSNLRGDHLSTNPSKN